ncbi:hypothetical protein DFJ74DRAFT_635594 [Hyaloraphidium curvatum]|nr:hypothetical protein DFJ74DRAFT_635594 [Hyaloraphidium curvatum]
MLDCLESAVRNHYIATKWNEDRYYSNIAASARAVLDFTVPDGIAVTLGKNVSPWLHTSYLLGIVPDRKSLGAIFLNAPLSDPSAGSSRESLFYGAAKALTEDMETRLGCSWTEATRFGDVMAYGQVFQDGSVDFLYSQRLHRNWLAVAAGRSTWQIAKSHVSRSPIASERSNANGFSSCARRSCTPRAPGCAASYPPSDAIADMRFPSVSLGFRLRQLYPQYRTNRIPIHSTFTTLVNPMMGHLSLAYVSTIRRGMDVACRYDLNLYSQESDLALGIEYAPPNSDQMMKARLCLSDGLSLLYEGRWRGAVVSLGLSLQLRGPNGAWDRSGMTATPKLGFFVTV